MKLSDQLRRTIVNEMANGQQFVAGTEIPAFPSKEVIHSFLLGSVQYMATSKDKWHLLEMTNEIFDGVNEEMIRFNLPFPLLRRGHIDFNDDLRIEGGEIMSIDSTHHSAYKRRWNELHSLRRKYEDGTARQYRKYNSLQALIRNHPEVGKLPCVTKALQHEKDVRKAAVDRRKTEVLEPIIVEDSASTAIAKARLLGAKFLS